MSRLPIDSVRPLRLSALVLTLAAACVPGHSLAASASDAAAVPVRVNQLGFEPEARKVAVVITDRSSDFAVVDVESGDDVLTGKLGEPAGWAFSEGQVALADFSVLGEPGEYLVRVDGVGDSAPFRIADGVYEPLNDAAIKAYYYNRASTGLPEEYAGDWARAAGHPDTEVLIHASAASESRPEGAVISSPKGWYDAGDYGKYVVNSGISTYTLLAALEHYGDRYADRDLNIPESGDAVPDLLDEAMWNLDWMLTMQDPDDGGVYHKLTTLNFVGEVMPADTHEPRYVVQKGTAATLNFAAVMAVASRVLDDYEDRFPGKAKATLAAAKRAWAWAQAHPDVPYRQPEDVHTGGYGDGDFADEFAWAAAELYITTGDDAYWTALNAADTPNAVPGWPQSLGLAWMSLARHRADLTEAADTALIEQRVTELADDILAAGEQAAWGVSMTAGDFVWGSNSVALNRAMMLLQAYELTDRRAYLGAAQALLDWVLGRNPTGYSFVTGFGARPPMDIHHRSSAADGVAAPVPGFLAGGPHSGQQDGCEYPSDLPAESYLDDWCSYSTNEVTINWNAPLVYVTGALGVYYED